ncbi:glycosyltransferase family 4 protein [Amorphus sp. 3PC139-8]|uniref:glycosyltransferase family 4 protein n=1 Tax=Amorphus sp. 3PC139-8 TaxID=2735676 RepID=UPI00345DBD0C
MSTLVFAIPGPLDTASGGYGYDRRVIDGLKALGHRVTHLALADGFPKPDADARAQTSAAFATIDDGQPTMVDGLALGVLPHEIAELARRAPVVALIHHPLALETDLTRERIQALETSERHALAACRHVVATSDATASVLAEHYGVDRSRLTVAPPGVDRPRAFAPLTADPPRLLSVGALVHRKGYDVLVDALAGLQDLTWTAEIVGDPERDPTIAADLVRRIEAHGLADRIQLAGRLDAAVLATRYMDANLFVISSRYEGYGMVASEAIAHGLPIVGTTGGALVDTIPDEVGLKVAPDDAEALSTAVRHVLESSALRTRLGESARIAAQDLPHWAETARTIATVIEGLNS